MRLITWNVLWRLSPDWRARERGILSVLERLQSDVVGLQECWGAADRTQADVIAVRLGLAHRAFVSPSLPPVPDPVEHDEQAGIALGIGLVSRWPIAVPRSHELPVTHLAFDETPEALDALVEGGLRGKVVVEVAA